MPSLLLKCLPCTRAQRKSSSPRLVPTACAKVFDDSELLSRKQSLRLQGTPDVARARGFELVVVDTTDADTQGDTKSKP